MQIIFAFNRRGISMENVAEMEWWMVPNLFPKPHLWPHDILLENFNGFCNFHRVYSVL